LEWEGLDWVGLVQDRDNWQVVVIAALNLRVSIKCGEFIDYLGTWLLKGGLCSMKLVSRVAVLHNWWRRYIHIYILENNNMH
jgi:hypothetical protein